jgi:hypothetical protein
MVAFHLLCVVAATADFSTAAANAPPSVEMTFLWVGRERQIETIGWMGAVTSIVTACAQYELC